jgi:hypothetical protein
MIFAQQLDSIRHRIFLFINFGRSLGLAQRTYQYYLQQVGNGIEERFKYCATNDSNWSRIREKTCGTDPTSGQTNEGLNAARCCMFVGPAFALAIQQKLERLGSELEAPKGYGQKQRKAG